MTPRQWTGLQSLTLSRRPPRSGWSLSSGCDWRLCGEGGWRQSDFDGESVPFPGGPEERWSGFRVYSNRRRVVRQGGHGSRGRQVRTEFVHKCALIFSGLKFSRTHVHLALPAELPPSPPLTSNVLHQCVSASTLPPCGREVPNRTTLSNPTVSPSTRTQTKHTDALTVTLLRLTLRPSEMLHKFNASPSSDHPPVRC